MIFASLFSNVRHRTLYQRPGRRLSVAAARIIRRCSSTVEHRPSKPGTRVRFPPPPPGVRSHKNAANEPRPSRVRKDPAAGDVQTRRRKGIPHTHVGRHGIGVPCRPPPSRSMRGFILLYHANFELAIQTNPGGGRETREIWEKTSAQTECGWGTASET